MRCLDELILRNALKQVDQAIAAMQAGGPVGETMAALHLSWAKSDIQSLLPKRQECE